MAEPSKLVEKAIGRLKATWNSVKNELFPSLLAVELASQSSITSLEPARD